MNPESRANESISRGDIIHQRKKTTNSVQSRISKSTKSNLEEELYDIEANEESLKPYSFSKQFLKLDLDKIRELIAIFEEYYLSLAEKDDVDLAKTAKQRLILLKKIEKENDDGS